MVDVVYTIGHSTHSSKLFLDLLRQHSITAVCDVRSRPYSRVNPQFNREVLKENLANASIRYVFLGKELGARTDDRSCYCNGKVQYDLLAKTELFRKGIDRVKKGMKEYRVALMCAEKEPLDCHRTILVARTLNNENIEVRHILANGSIEEHQDALKRLVRTLRLPTADMFLSEETVLNDAYARQGESIAYQETVSDEASSTDHTGHNTSGAAE
jgi:uncharacterized protein (DUF488 family)